MIAKFYKQEVHLHRFSWRRCGWTAYWWQPALMGIDQILDAFKTYFFPQRILVFAFYNLTALMSRSTLIFTIVFFLVNVSLLVFVLVIWSLLITLIDDWLSEMPKVALLCPGIKSKSYTGEWVAELVSKLQCCPLHNNPIETLFTNSDHFAMGYNFEEFMQGLVYICLVVQCASYVWCCIICIICIICILICCFDFLLFVCLPLGPHCRLDLVMMWQWENLKILNFNCFVKTVPSNLNED